MSDSLRRCGCGGEATRSVKVATATAVIGKTRLIVDQSFRTLNAPRAPAEVAEGVPYADGIPVKPIKATAHEKAAS